MFDAQEQIKRLDVLLAAERERAAQVWAILNAERDADWAALDAMIAEEQSRAAPLIAWIEAENAKLDAFLQQERARLGVDTPPRRRRAPRTGRVRAR